MKSARLIAVVLGAAVFSVPAIALPLETSLAGSSITGQNLTIPVSSWGERASGASKHYRNPRRHAAPAEEDYSDASEPVGAYGGYVVNRYGSGNYVSGPAGFAGYPAGSGPDFIYRQQENMKCEYVPESCF